MPFNSRRWQVSAITARVRASAAISSADMDATTRANRKLELLRIADGVDSGQISSDEAATAFTRIADEVTTRTRGPFGPAVGM